MSREHRLMWNGMDLETSLSDEQIWATVGNALVSTKGKIRPAAESGRVKAFTIVGSETLFATAPELTFEVKISSDGEGDDRRIVRMDILRAMLKSSSIPFGPKHMLGHKAFMRLVHTVNEAVAAADASSVAQIREGVRPA